MKSNSKDWDICEYGSAMEKLGYFTNDKYATADTLYGDWSCTTYNTDTKEEIGYYCADAGLVSVFSLEILNIVSLNIGIMKNCWIIEFI